MTVTIQEQRAYNRALSSEEKSRLEAEGTFAVAGKK
jgi:hypothetical protein